GLTGLSSSSLLFLSSPPPKNHEKSPVVAASASPPNVGAAPAAPASAGLSPHVKLTGGSSLPDVSGFGNANEFGSMAPPAIGPAPLEADEVGSEEVLAHGVLVCGEFFTAKLDIAPSCAHVQLVRRKPDRRCSRRSTTRCTAEPASGTRGRRRRTC